MNAVPSMLPKPAEILPIEFLSIKRKIPLWDNTSLSVVVQRILLNGRFLMHVEGLKK